ncbi:MAG TPA: helix-turn-helix transcriptional regulator [Thermoanaerobaculia bacterium]|jgi:DNA-binding PadR family transcriptional regulator|nr:helix-turn-helix transcriptional regulator [Thermoanaerobaculia bacterium]
MRSELTELERCTLGVIWRDGPMTAYEVAALYARSLSPYWSGSAGAVYPLVKRLRQRGLIRGLRRAWNGKKKTVLEVTDAGVATLREWLTPPLPPDAAAPSQYPLRTRLYFVDVLSDGEKRAFFRDAERAVREQLAAAKKQRRQDADAANVSEAIGHLGVVYELEARLRWLRAARGALGIA